MSMSDLARQGISHLPLRTRRRVRNVLVKNLPPRYRPTVRQVLGVCAPWEPAFDFTPRRALEPGEKAGPPDFVGIASQGAGTTRWHKLILAHPGVSRPAIDKELHYFDRFGSLPFGPEDVERYHSWFPRREGMLTGEWTPTYFNTPGTAPLLKAAAPDCRLILLFRDPVERFRSGVNHASVMGLSNRYSTQRQIGRGFYDRYLSEWLECFDEEQLLFLQYERCVEDPEGQLKDTYRHLGLTDYRPAQLQQHAGTRTDKSVALDPDVKRRLVAIYEPDVLALSKRLPGLDLSLWPNFSHLAENARTSTRTP